jgi:hypothetical protein
MLKFSSHVLFWVSSAEQKSLNINVVRSQTFHSVLVLLCFNELHKAILYFSSTGSELLPPSFMLLINLAFIFV